MKMNVVEVKNEKSFKSVGYLYKSFLKKHTKRDLKDFQNFILSKDICFKKFYLNKKFIGLFKGIKTNDFLFISYFSPAREEYIHLIIDKIKDMFASLDIVLMLKSGESKSEYQKLGFKDVELNSSLKAFGTSFLSTNPNSFDSAKIINAIKFNDWPFMFPSPYATYVYYSDVSKLKLDKILDKLLVERKNKIDALKFEKDKKLSAGVWLLLKKALNKHGVKISDYKYSTSSSGKPFLVECNYHFSLSHSGNYVVVALSQDPIGIDIQEMSRDIADILDIIGNDNDKNYVTSSSNPTDALYKIWTFKEAASKESGLGLYAPFKTININYEFNYNGKFFFEFNVVPNYKISVCSPVLNVKNPKKIRIY